MHIRNLGPEKCSVSLCYPHFPGQVWTRSNCYSRQCKGAISYVDSGITFPGFSSQLCPSWHCDLGQITYSLQATESWCVKCKLRCLDDLWLTDDKQKVLRTEPRIRSAQKMSAAVLTPISPGLTFPSPGLYHLLMHYLWVLSAGPRSSQVLSQWWLSLEVH